MFENNGLVLMRLPPLVMACLCLIALPSVAKELEALPNQLAINALAEQARFWSTGGRIDLAEAAWRRLIQVDPKNQEALTALAKITIGSNRPSDAKAILETLRAQPDVATSSIRRIENSLAQNAGDNPVLEQARLATQQERISEAVKLYRDLFDRRQPAGSLGVEFYQVLGGTSSGWEEARSGLLRLSREESRSVKVQLAYAKHLTYRSGSREEGIQLLSRLARSPEVANEAIDAWRMALVWLDARSSDLALFQAYLKIRPLDEVIKAKANELGKSYSKKLSSFVDAKKTALQTGFSDLDRGDMSSAENKFDALISANPKNATALGGLGIVRMKQERFADAEKLLSSAFRISGNKSWAEALNTSRFWLAMQDGMVRRDEGKLDLAKEAYQRAQKLDLKAPIAKAALVKALTLIDQFADAQNVLGTMADGPDRREASQQLVKRKAARALDAKEYAEAERMLLVNAEHQDVEGQELLAWARYHQGKLVEAAKGFADVYKQSPSKGAASGLVFSFHNQKSYHELFAMAQKDTGPLSGLVSLAVQKKFAEGETRFDVEGDGRLVEVDPLIILTEDVLLPASMALFNEKNAKKAYELLAPVENKLIEIGDYSMLAALGLAAIELGDEATALRTLKRGAEETEVETYYFAWGTALIRFGRDEDAESVMLKWLEISGADVGAESLTLLGWTESRLGKHDKAADHFAAAYAKEPSPATAQALVYGAVKAKKPQLLLVALAKDPDGPLSPLVPQDARTQIAAGVQQFYIDSNAHLVAILDSTSGTERDGISLKLEPRIRTTSGVAGENKLRQVGLVATLGWQGQAQHATLEVERQHATDAVDRAEGQRWYAKLGTKMGPNIGLQLGFGRTFTGSALRPANVGEAGVGYYVPEGGVNVRVFRRGSEASLLALTGTLDVPTGIHWGRLLEQGLDVNAYHKGDGWEKQASLVISRIEGESVADNRKFELYARALRSIDALPGFSLGPDVYVSRFSRNLGAFEPGHGGYFSPSRSMTLGAVGRYETSLGSVAVTFTGGLGWAHSSSDAAPGDPMTGARPGAYPASTGRGLAYQGRIDGLQPLSPEWSLGFGLGKQRSSSFSDWRANLYVQRHWFK